MRLNLSPRAALLTSISALAVTVATPTVVSAQAVEVDVFGVAAEIADTVCARLSAAAQSAVAGSVAAHARRPWPWPWRSPAGARRSFRG